MIVGISGPNVIFTVAQYRYNIQQSNNVDQSVKTRHSHQDTTNCMHSHWSNTRIDAFSSWHWFRRSNATTTRGSRNWWICSWIADVTFGVSESFEIDYDEI